MPNFGMTRQQRQAAKWLKLFEKLGAPCRFHSVDDPENPYIRLFDDAGSTGLSAAYNSNEYVPEKILQAAFLLSQGPVNIDDEYETGTINETGEFVPDGNRYRLTVMTDIDTITATFVYLQL